MRVSIPAPPLRMLLALLPVMMLLFEFPVPLMAFTPIRVRFSTVLARLVVTSATRVSVMVVVTEIVLPRVA